MTAQIEKMRILASIIAELESKHDGVAPLSEVKNMAEGKGISEEFVDEFIRREKAEGRMYSPAENKISRLTATPWMQQSDSTL